MKSNPQPMRILLVDEHILFREGLAMMMSAEPDIQIVGDSGSIRSALEKTRQFQPDIILTEISLPDGDGFELIDSVYRIAPDVQVVILTVHDSDQFLIRALMKGARGYLLKNGSIAGLVSALRAIRRGEAALSRKMAGRVLEEVGRLSKIVSTGESEVDGLTFREIQVLACLSMDASNREIGMQLSIAENTVKAHVRNILQKLNLKNRREAALFGRRTDISRYLMDLTFPPGQDRS